jgi:NPCBM/NEW2 domain
MSHSSPRSTWLRRTLFALASVFFLSTRAQAAFLGLAWDPNPEADVAGYILFYGTTSGSYSTSVDVGNTTTWNTDTLTEGQPYFFAVLAYDTNGRRSPLSTEITARPFTAARMHTPTPGSTLTGASASFQWSAGSGVSQYRLSVGTAFGGTTTFDQTVTGTTATVSGLPASGTVFVRLWSLIGSTWHFTDYTYATATATKPTLRVTTYLSDRLWTSMVNGWGPVERDRSNGEDGAGDGRTLTLNGVTFAKGLGAHSASGSASEVRYALGGRCSAVTAVVGVDDEIGAGGSVVFQVWADGVKKYDSGVMTATTANATVHADVTGAAELALVMTDAGDGFEADHGDWAQAQVTCTTK